MKQNAFRKTAVFLVLLAAALLFAGASGPALAADSGFETTVLNGTYCSVTGYTGGAAVVEIPAEIGGYIVQAVGKNAFKGKTGITEVVLADTVETIGESAFEGCTGLIRFTGGSGLTEIGSGAFRDCASLTQIRLGESMNLIGAYAFSGCAALTDAELGGTRTIHAYAFSGCAGLRSITLPDSVAGMSARVFNNCPNLVSANWPAGWTETYNSYNNNTSYYGGDEGDHFASPFLGSGIRSVTVPEGVKTIPKHALRGMTGVTEVRLPQSLETVSDYAFFRSGITAAEMPGSVGSIGPRAFSGCASLEEIEIPSGVTLLEGYVFENCTGLREVRFPEGLKKIYAYAFSGCTGLTSVRLPDGVEGLSARAFNGCANLTEINFPAEWTETYNSYNNGTSYYGGDGGGEFASPFLGTGIRSVTVPEGVTAVPKHAFRGLTGLEEAVLPESVVSIGIYAFNGCTSLTEIEIPDGVTLLDVYVFENCTGLRRVKMPADLEKIYAYAFRGCTGLESVGLPDGVTGMSARAFDNCPNLTEVNFPAGWTETYNSYNNGTSYYGGDGGGEFASPFLGTGISSVTVPEGVKTIPKHAFRGLTGLTEVDLPQSLETVSDYAFYGSGITAAEMSGSVGSIGPYAFGGCASLEEIEIPEGVTLLDACVFENCTALREVRLPESLKKIYAYAFSGCTGLESIVLPDGVEGMTARAFNNCPNLTEINFPAEWKETYNTYNNGTSYYGGDGGDSFASPFAGTGIRSVTVPEGVTAVPKHAFRGVTGLREAALPESLRSIGSYAFTGCTSLTEIEIPDGVTLLDVYVFDNCTGLRQVKMPANLEKIYAYAFRGCTSLESVGLPDGVTGMSAGAFQNCANLTAVNFPAGWKETYNSYNNGVSYYGGDGGDSFASPFVGTGIRSVTVPAGVTAVPKHAFRGVTTLTLAALPDSVTEIMAYAFYGCTGLQDISMGENLTEVGAQAFTGVPETMTVHGVRGSFAEQFAEGKFAFTDEPLDLATGSFSGRFTAAGEGLPGVTVTVYDTAEGYAAAETVSGADGSWTAGGLRTKREYLVSWYKRGYAFGEESRTILLTEDGYAFETLDGMELGAGEETPEDYFTITALNGSFCSVTGYTGEAAEVVIPAAIGGYTVQTVGKNAFRGKTGITSVVLADTIETVEEGAFSGCTGLTRFLSGSGLKKIGLKAFQNCSGLTEVRLGNHMEEIGSYAFDGCAGLESLHLGTAATLGSYAFARCTGLTEFRPGPGLKLIGEYAFSGCSSLTDVDLTGVQKIYTYAFSGCAGLESIVIPDSVTGLSARVFDNCPNLVSVNWPTGWTETYNSYNNNTSYYGGDGGDSFASPFLGSGIRSMTVPEGVKTIPKHAFRGMTGLTEVNLPQSLQTVSGYAFFGSGIREIDLKNTGTIGPRAFGGCTSLTEIGIPEGVTLLDERVFENCTGLREVRLPESLRKIYAYAFSGCTGLTSVRLPDGVTGMTARAFDNCPKLTAVNFPAAWTETYNTYNNGTSYYGGDGGDSFASPFAGTGIRNVVVPAGVPAVPKHAFRGVTTLRLAALPDSVTDIGAYAFYGCTGLQDISMGENLTAVGAEAFTGVPETMTVHGVRGSFAEQFAEGRFAFTDDALDLATGSFSGRFTAEGAGLPGVTVTVYDTAESYAAAETVSGADGSWTAGGLMANREYTVSWYRRGYAFGEDSRTILLTEDGYVFETLDGTELGAGEETPEDYFTITALNGSFCSVTGYTGEAAEVVIPATIGGYMVQTVGKNAFRGNTEITSVTLADTIETVEEGAFSGCTGLTRFLSGSGLKKIGLKAFQNCSGLAEVRLGNRMEEIGNYAFDGCTGLKSLRLGSTVTLGSCAFARCAGLTELRPGTGLKVIGEYAFSGCYLLTNVDLTGVQKIYAYAFSGCTGLERIVIPDSVTGLSARVFDNCPNLVSANWPKGWTETYNSYNNNTSYYGGDGGDSFASPFLGSGIRSMTVPEGVKTIPKQAFRGMTGLTEVNLPQSLQTVSDYAFFGSGIREIGLKNTGSIGPHAFGGCASLTEIEIPEGVTLLDECVFENCTALREVRLPESLRKIYAYAFRGCTGLTSVRLPDGVTGMTARAFDNCPNLTAVNFPAAWTETYNTYNNGTGYYGGDGGDSFASPFAGSGIRSVTVPEGIRAVPKHAFRGVSLLQEAVLPESLETIGAYAFCGAENLTDCALPDGLTSVGAYAFAGTKKLYTLTLPEGISSLGEYAWQNSIGLRNIYLNGEITALPAGCFSGCNGLISVVIHGGISSLTANTFSSCQNLKSIEIPRTVETVNDKAFDNCPKLVVYCWSNSAAHLAAERNGWAFVLIDDHEHLYETAVDTEPTCTRGGSELRVCSVCGYSYIELVDPLGHDFEETVTRDKEPTCTETGEESRHCTRCGERTDITALPMLPHSWSEWTTEREATLFETGLRRRECAACGETEEEIIPKKGSVNPDLTKYGYATFTVVNAETLQPIPGAKIMIATESDGEGVLVTDTSGRAIHLLPAGRMEALVHADGFGPRTLNITVTAGTCEIPRIGLSDRDLVEGSLTATEMTLDEMIAAGIDVDAPENTHFYKYAVHLGFNATIDFLNMNLYKNKTTGELVWADGDCPGWTCIRPGVLPNPGPVRPGFYFVNREEDIAVYPVSEYFYIIIYGEVKWTKEIYDVELCVINHSGTDTLENCRAVLNIPDGMQLAKMSGAQQSASRDIGRLAGGQLASVHWYLCGNEAGLYYPSVNLTGVLEPFHESVDRVYTVLEPLSVLAGNAMRLTYTVPDAAYYGKNYVFRAELENVSDKTLYGVESAITGVEEGKLTRYSNGVVTKEIYYTAGELVKLSREYFYPGDKIVLQGSIPVFFDSVIIQNMKDQIIRGVRAAGVISDIVHTIDDALSLVEDLSEIIENYDDVVDMLWEIADGDPELFRALLDIKDDTDSVYALYKTVKFLLGLKGDEFSVTEAVCNVIQSIPVRYELISREVEVFPESTAVIPTVIRTEHVEGDNWAVVPDEYVENLTKVLIGDNVGLFLKELGPVGEWAVKKALGYDESMNYLKAVDQELKSISVFTVDPATECRAWVESGNVRLGMRGNSETRDGKLCFQGNAVLDFVPLNGQDDTVYIDFGNGDVRTFKIEVSPVHTHVCGRRNVIIPPTEISGGLAIGICSICGEVMDVEKLEYCAEEHQFSEWDATVVPTPEYCGIEERACSACHTVEYRVVDAVPEAPDAFLLPEGLKAVGEEAFSGLPVQIVRIPDTVKSIGARAFADCRLLRKVYIPASVESIGEDAFSGCRRTLVIYGVPGSEAERYAAENGLKFERAEDENETSMVPFM